MKPIFSISLVFLFLLGCNESSSVAPISSPSSEFKEETWRLSIQLAEEEIPFIYSIERDASGSVQSSSVHNGSERIPLQETQLWEDSIAFSFPVFASSIRAQINGDSLQGIWYNDARKTKNRLAVLGQKGDENRFPETSQSPVKDFSGNWEVTFVYKEEDTSKALGIFTQEGNHLLGTFRTPTGDYRFLEGNAYGDRMWLSTFDGAHAFLFTANMNSDSRLAGTFWSGDHWIESWTAFKNDDFSLPNPDSLTFMKEADETFTFSFLNSKNELVSLDDDAYADKAVVVQILGSWCPNCKDETAWLVEKSKDLPREKLEMIALDFELSTDTSKAFENINRMAEYFQIPYQVLFAGRAGKSTASAALPQLNHVMSYPTTIFLDRNHKVKRVYTGFNGPATGVVYDKLTESFEETMRAIM